MTETVTRFRPGQSGNPAGRPKLTTEQRLERLLERHGAATLQRAFVVAQHDDAVLAGLLAFLAASLNADNVQHMAAANTDTTH